MAWTAHKDDEYMEERYDDEKTLEAKLDDLAKWVKESKHFVVFTGAGISTSAGIPDFRGPQGVWTLKAQGKQRTAPTTPTIKALPTLTHMALVKLQQEGILKYLISQNCDGIHRRSGIPPTAMSELHGNGNIEECEDCGKRYFRDLSCYRIYNSKDHFTGRFCNAMIKVPKNIQNMINKKSNSSNTSKTIADNDDDEDNVMVDEDDEQGEEKGEAPEYIICGGRLLEWTIDFGQNLPKEQLSRAWEQSHFADLHLVLGSSLTVSPACDMPKQTAQRGGKLVIGNLQKTPLAKLGKNIHAPTDVIMKGLMKRLNLEIPQWVLRRRFIIAHQISDKGLHLQVTGVDPHDDNLSADLFPEIEFKYSSDKYQPLQNKWYKLRGNADENTSNAKNGFGDVKVRLHCMRHYGEPPITIKYRLSGKTAYTTYTVTYDITEGAWKTEKSEVKTGEISNSLKLGFHEISVKSLPLKGDVDASHMLWNSSAMHTAKDGTKTLYIFGGHKPPYIQALDVATLTWKKVTPKKIGSGRVPFVDVARWGNSACILPTWSTDKIVLFGGWDSKSQYCDVHVFNCLTHEIEYVTTKTPEKSKDCEPTPRAGHSATAIGKYMVIFGGSWCSGGPYKYSNTLYALDVTTNTWESLADAIGEAPKGRAQHGACLVWSRFLLIAGGISGEWVESDIFCFDIKKKLWHRVRAQGDKIAPLSVDTVDFRVTPSQVSCTVVDHDRVLLTGFGGSASVCLYTMSSGTVESVNSSLKLTQPNSNTNSSGNSSAVSTAHDENFPALTGHVMCSPDEKSVVLIGGYDRETQKCSEKMFQFDFQ